VAFLIMDLEAGGFPSHAQAFRNGYLARSGDFAACRLLRLYQTHRALVRAKITGLEAAGAEEETARGRALKRHREYLGYAEQHIGPRRPRLILMYGLSGAGKTWLAERLAPLLDAIHVRSDVERKRLAGLAEPQRSQSAPGQGLYSPDISGLVYERLAECAGHAVAGGYTAILDAAFHRREDRAALHKLALRLAVPVQLIHCRASRAELEARLKGRARAGVDASEADLSVLNWQQAHVQPVLDSEGFEIIDADTTSSEVVPRVRRHLLQTT
jgi:hypothetical protein